MSIVTGPSHCGLGLRVPGTRRSRVTTVHCPHCLLAIADDVAGGYPERPMRCPHCRLTVAPGRARHDVPEGQVSSGSAAGVMASAARRADAPPVTDEAVDRALEQAAREVGTSVQRLRMIDYQRVAGPEMPDLSSILERYGNWKAARRAVVTHLGRDVSEAT